MAKRINALLYKGLRIRMGLMIFGLVCGLLVGPGFSILGLLINGEQGPLFFWLGVVMTLFLLALVWILSRENLQNRIVLQAVKEGSGIDKIYHIKINPRSTGPEGKFAEKVLKPFHHIFIHHSDGYAVRFFLPKNECLELFCLLMRRFPKVRYYHPEEFLEFVHKQLPDLDIQNRREQKSVYSEIKHAEINNLKRSH